MASKLRRTWLVVVSAGAVGVLVVHLSVKGYDLSLKAASLKNLRDVVQARSEHCDELDRSDVDWRELLASIGAIRQGQLTDLRSGQPYCFVSFDPGRIHLDVSRPVAYSPLSACPVKWWFGKSSAGCIVYVDGHGEWHDEAEFRRILADHGLAP